MPWGQCGPSPPAWSGEGSMLDGRLPACSLLLSRLHLVTGGRLGRSNPISSPEGACSCVADKLHLCLWLPRKTHNQGGAESGHGIGLTDTMRARLSADICPRCLFWADIRPAGTADADDLHGRNNRGRDYSRACRVRMEHWSATGSVLSVISSRQPIARSVCGCAKARRNNHPTCGRISSPPVFRQRSFLSLRADFHTEHLHGYATIVQLRQLFDWIGCYGAYPGLQLVCAFAFWFGGLFNSAQSPCSPPGGAGSGRDPDLRSN